MQKPLFGYVIAAIIGAIVFVVVGYFVYATDPGGWAFGYWLFDPIRRGVWKWALTGAAIGAGLRAITLLTNPEGNRRPSASSNPVSDFLAFIIFALTWTGAAGLLLSTKAVNLYAIFAVWIVGFVWGVGYIASGKRDADHLVKVWLGMLAGYALFGCAVYLVS